MLLRCVEHLEDKKVLDLGSSTAKFLLDLHSKMEVKMQLKGLDNSQAMLDRAEQKCQAFGAEDQREHRCRYPLWQEVSAQVYPVLREGFQYSYPEGPRAG